MCIVEYKKDILRIKVAEISSWIVLQVRGEQVFDQVQK